MNTSQTFYDNLHAQLSAPGKRSLERIKTACDTLAKKGQTINVAAVGRECLIQFKGPTHGSIRNHKEYTQYVGLRAAEATLANPCPIEPVFNPSQQAYVNQLKDQLHTSERKYKLLHELLDKHIEELASNPDASLPKTDDNKPLP
jgi:hypothetical protein